MSKWLLLPLAALALHAESSKWVDAVSPVLSSAEKRAYLSLAPEARTRFEENFWAEKSIAPEEYYRRLEYVDSTYGSTKTASGANTDPGRVYLSLGPPNRVTRIPSSRIFAPLEIWYYDTVPAIRLNTELRLIFYQKNEMGLPRLYSPTLDTIRALLLPQSSTRGMFGPNDQITEADVRTKLTVGPAEDEVISAAINVATGIKSSGNDEILARIASPALILGKHQQTDVQSRFIVSRPSLDVVQSVSEYGGRQVDLVLQTTASHSVDLQVLEGSVSIYQNQLHLDLRRSQPLQYTHRLDLLPGSYTLIFSLDGKSFPYALVVPEKAATGDLLRVNESGGSPQRPLAFGGRSFTINARGRFALLALPAPGDVTWTVRKGLQVISKSNSDGSRVALFEIPAQLEQGAYTLEAESAGVTRSMEFVAGKAPNSQPEPTVLSFNANLRPAQRLAFIGHQWLLRDKVSEARRCLQASLTAGSTKEAETEMARVEALSAEWDAARNRARAILARYPNDFEALSVFAYVETKLQDYAVAAQLYRRALALQDSPALRLALSKLPQASVSN